MSESAKLINVKVDLSSLEGLSDAVKIFVGRISDEIGEFTKPYHARRTAQAKADIAIIEAENQNKVSEIQERGLRRMVVEEGKRQENIESIVAKAIPHVEDNANAGQVERDWIADFFDRCKLISNNEMQEIWARLLAQESNAPQSISKRTIALLSSLDKRDAEIFTKFCRHVWIADRLTPLIFDYQSGPAFDEGMNFDVLTHLDTIGLIAFDALSGIAKEVKQSKVQISCYGRTLIIEFPGEEKEFQVGHALLTEAGSQLAMVCRSTPSQSAYEYAVGEIYKNGFTLSSVSDIRGF